MKMLKKVLAMTLVLVMVFSCATVAFAAQRGTTVEPKVGGDTKKTITPAELPGDLKDLTVRDFQELENNQYAADDVVTAIVVMEGDAAIDVADNGTTKAVAQEAKLAKQHNTLKDAMKTAGVNFTVQFEYSALLNGMAISVAYGDLNKIAAMDGVSSVHIANTYDAPVVEAVEKNAFANQMTGAALLQDYGFNGEGTVIAVLDTGTTTTHEAFQDYGITAEDGLTKAEVEATKTIGAGKYLSAKIPFACDYAGEYMTNPVCDDDVTDFNGHGTHVAGSALGYAEDEDGAITFAGAAPGAQLLAMKIFGDKTSGTNSAIYFAAIEDAYRLGADVISMSIGAQNGFTYDPELEDEVFGNIYAKMEEKGVIMSIAAGNEGTMGDYSNNWVGGGAVLGSYADYGVVGTPSTYGNNVSIAAVENIAYPADSLTVGGNDISYSDASDTAESNKLKGNTYEYVMVPNYGAADDYANLDVTGKVAVVSRGDITFSEKEAAAAAAGAAALVVYNNTTGVINMAIEQYDIPAVSITQAGGQIMAEAEEKVVTFNEEKTIFENENAWLACSFSSMGTTGDLAFKPMLSSVGGNVYSASMSGDHAYELMSGTSMATPNASGNFAQLTQYVNEMFLTDATCYAENFTDVDLNKWYHKAVDFVVSEGLVFGITDTTFGPELKLSRGQMVTILYRQAGKPDVTGLDNPFVDVPANQYYYSAVVWAANNGVVFGVDDTHFAPNANVTREQLVSILWRYAGRPEAEDCLKDYTDKADVSAYAVPALNWAVTERIITSMSTDTLIISPKSDTTRAQFARIMMVFLNGSYDCTGKVVDRVNRSQFVKDLAESTALVLADNDYQLYTPRKQGAGLFNVAAAVTADAYIPSPLLELGDDADRTGVYDLSFDVVSLSDETTYFEIDPWTMVDAAGATKEGQYYNLMTASYTDATFTTNWEDDILVLPAGATEHVEITITLDEETVAYLEAAFENGGYVDGYAVLWQLEENEEGKLVQPDSMPYIHASFLAFYGDWTEAPILETYDFTDAIEADAFLNNTDAGEFFGNSNYSGYSLADLGLTYFDLFEMDTDINFAFLAETEDGVPVGLYDYLGGSLYFYNEQNDAYNAISNGASKTGNYLSDMFYAMPTQLRNARHVIMTVTNAETGELYYVDDTEYLPKAYYDTDYASWMQNGSFYWDGVNYMADEPYYVDNNTQVAVNFYANLPYGEDELGAIDYADLLEKGADYLEWNFNLTVDNQAPVLGDECDLSEEGLLTVSVADNGYVATVQALDSNFDLIDGVLAEAEPGEAGEYTLDLGDYTGDVYILTTDYATNFTIGVIESEGGDEDETVYEWVSEIADDMSGEYAITGMNTSALYLLDASGETTGTDLGTAAGAIDWNDTDVMCSYDLMNLYYIDDTLTWCFEKTTDGYYTICMKGSDNYLACTADGKLTTVTDATAAEAKWDFQMIEEPVDDGSGDYYALCDLSNVGTGLTLLFDSENSVFGCFDASYDDVYNLDVYVKIA